MRSREGASISAARDLVRKGRIILLLIILTSVVWSCSSFWPSIVTSPQIGRLFERCQLDELDNDCTHFNGYDESRRNVIDLVAKSSSLLPFMPFGHALAAEATFPPRIATQIPSFGLNDEVVRSLIFQRILGLGSFKTIYLVSGSDKDGARVRYALAVERLRGKSDTKDAFRGVRIPLSIQGFVESDDKDLFEKIEGWWLQSSSLPEYAEGKSIFPNLDRIQRTQKEPGKFLGSKWLISFKPVYDMDLKRFAQKAPVLYPVGERNDGNVDVVAGLHLTEPVAMKFVLETLHAAELMHEAGLVHRDIKPKNIMIYRKRPVIIDYGFAQFGRPEKDNKICVVQLGQVKGEVRYVLAQDVARYRGCREGDAYAMGKTLYEFIFSSATGPAPSGRQKITEEEAMAQNEIFRDILFADGAGRDSRFHLSRSAADCLLSAIRGLCRRENALTFAQTKQILMGYHEKT